MLDLRDVRRGIGIGMERGYWEKLNGHRGAVVWFTGLSGSGKTTIAVAAERMLAERGVRCVVLDGDALRSRLSRDLGFSDADRMEHNRRVAEVAALFLASGFVVVVPLISPTEAIRTAASSRFEPEDYVEVYVRCGLAECERRDPKGLYRMARSGALASFTGISATYEPPAAPDVTLDNERAAASLNARLLIRYLKERGIVPLYERDGAR